ncbi:MAG: RDD family protein [Cytophagales bacterium]|nr:RDD family protein [Cytophagales bacterium]
MNTNYASFGQRLVAIIIDSIIIGVVQSFVFIPILAAMGLGFASGAENMDMSDPDQAAGMIGTIMASMGAIWILAMVIRSTLFHFNGVF